MVGCKFRIALKIHQRSVWCIEYKIQFRRRQNSVTERPLLLCYPGDKPSLDMIVLWHLILQRSKQTIREIQGQCSSHSEENHLFCSVCMFRMYVPNVCTVYVCFCEEYQIVVRLILTYRKYNVYTLHSYCTNSACPTPNGYRFGFSVGHPPRLTMCWNFALEMCYFMVRQSAERNIKIHHCALSSSTRIIPRKL